ncbi:MAG TPA: hypothetical protein VF241_06085 [Propionibacteriaceae bacterium]
MTIVGVIIDGTVYPLQSELSIAQKKAGETTTGSTPVILAQPLRASQPR